MSKIKFLLIVVSIFILIVPRAWSEMTLDQIMSKHLGALGGWEKISAIKTEMVKSKVKTGGLEGEVIFWTKYPDKIKQQTDFSIFKQTIVYDGKTAWIKDQNGKVRELVGQEKINLQKGLFFDNFSYLLKDKGGKLNYLGEKEIEGKKYYIVEATPDIGDPRTLYINPMTFLIDRYEEKYDMIPITVFCDDYRRIEGVQVPFHILQSTGKKEYDTDIYITEVSMNLPLDDQLFSQPKEEAKDWVFPSGQNFVVVPIELNSNHIYVKVKINDSAFLYFILDTGAGASCIDRDRAKQMGLVPVGKFEARGVGGSDSASILKLDKLSLDELDIFNQTVVAISFKELNKYEGREIDGIFGYDFISRFVVEIDYQNNLLKLYDPEFYQYKGEGQTFNIALDGNVPGVKGLVDGKIEGYFHIDTGSRSGLDLHAPFVDKYGFMKQYPKHLDTFSGVGVGGKSKGVVSRIKSFQLRNFVIPEPITGFSLAEEGAFASIKTDGNIGGGILKRFKAIFDYSKSQMILEKNSNFDLPEKYDMSGMWLLAENGKVYVTKVLKNSPAEKAKIKEGDEIISINNVSTSQYSLEQIREMFKGKENERFKLKIKSGERAKETELTLKSLI
jgi:outer membrane lipoprotein-sorting protein